MRRPGLASLASFALIALGGCTTTRADGSPQVETSTEANEANIKGAMAAPLRDVNVLRTKIPEVLLAAMADPYGRPEPATCAQIILLVRPLDDALGPDLDAPAPDEDDLMQRGQQTAMGAVAGLTTDVIPFRGWVRRLSGAEQHDRLVQSAILAGAVRRAYLKGLGETRGCTPPATPSHEKAGAPPVEEHRGPRYPIR